MQNDPERRPDDARPDPTEADTGGGPTAPGKPKEVGGPPGPEPTRYGDWEKGGRCIDF